MAIYHLTCVPHSRSKGHSATAGAAYRAGARIVDERTGEIHDYTRKRGILRSEIVLPENAPAWAQDRSQLWNAAELAEKRKNSTVTRDFEISLPRELSNEQRQELALQFAREMVKRHGFALDISFHKPERRGDQRNFHAHLFCSTRRLTAEGFGEKTRELDDKVLGPEEIKHWRARWAELQNEYLKEHGHSARVDHRSLKDQGIDREPTRHKGPALTALERRGEPSHVMERWKVEDRLKAVERLQQAAQLGRLEREGQSLEQSILDLSNDLAAAKRERNFAIPAANPSSVLADRFHARLSLEEERRRGREAWEAMRQKEPKISDEERRRQARENWEVLRRGQETETDEQRREREEEQRHAQRERDHGHGIDDDW